MKLNKNYRSKSVFSTRSSTLTNNQKTAPFHSVITPKLLRQSLQKHHQSKEEHFNLQLIYFMMKSKGNYCPKQRWAARSFKTDGWAHRVPLQWETLPVLSNAHSPAAIKSVSSSSWWASSAVIIISQDKTNSSSATAIRHRQRSLLQQHSS